MLRLSSFLVGVDYRDLKNETPYSKMKVNKLATAMLIPISLWVIQGYLLATVVLMNSWEIGLLTALVCGTLVFLLEKLIVQGGKNPFSIGFRVIIALLLASIGAIALDEIIFEKDINTKVEEYKITYITDAGNIAKREHAKEIEALEKEKVLYTRLWNKALKKAEEEADGKGGSGASGVGAITKLKLNNAANLKAQLDAVESRLFVKRSGELKSVAKAKSEANDAFKPGLIIKVKALFELIGEDLFVRIAWIGLTVLLLCMELMVVIVKLTTKESSYDRKVEAIENIGMKRIARLEVVKPILDDPGEKITSNYKRRQQLFG